QKSAERVEGEGRAGAGFAIALFVSLALALTIPRGTVALLPLIALAALWTCRPEPKSLGRAMGASPGAWGLSAFLLYAAVNAVWSLDPPDAYEKVAIAALSLLLALAILHVTPRLAERQAQALLLALAAAVAFGTLLFAVEVLMDQSISGPIRRMLA